MSEYTCTAGLPFLHYSFMLQVKNILNLTLLHRSLHKVCTLEEMSKQGPVSPPSIHCILISLYQAYGSSAAERATFHLIRILGLESKNSTNIY